MALDTPVRDQPVACVIGCRNTASDIIAPTATQLISAPMATITHPYWTFIASSRLVDTYSRSGGGQIDISPHRARHEARPRDG